MKKIIQLFCFLTILGLTSCKNDQKKTVNPTEETPPIEALTSQWNTNLNDHDLQSLAPLYADQVAFYSKSFSKEQVISDKNAFIKKYPDFKQSITGNIVLDKINDNQYSVSFPKHTSFNNKTLDVQEYLVFEKIDGSWKITHESDRVLPKNPSPTDTEKEASNNCINTVMEILTTSPTYLKKTKGLKEAVVKNGGKSIGITIEGSPNPKTDGAMAFSATYDFSLHETYADHMPVIARFTFDPTDKQLYEYDVVQDTLTPINFDKSLLWKVKELCGQ